MQRGSSCQPRGSFRAGGAAGASGSLRSAHVCAMLRVDAVARMGVMLRVDAAAAALARLHNGGSQFNGLGVEVCRVVHFCDYRLRGVLRLRAEHVLVT